jgi:hypothetical protein
MTEKTGLMSREGYDGFINGHGGDIERDSFINS